MCHTHAMPRRIARSRRRRLAAAIAAASVVVVLAGCGGGGDSTEPATTEAPTTTETPATEPAAPEGDAANGATIFESAGCSGCHTLSAAGSTGSVGPNLDDLAPTFETVVNQVTNGGGAMPAFSGQLSEQEIADVAAYVVESTSG